MNTIWVYGLWLLLSPSTANAVWCFHCNTQNFPQSCPVKKEFCWASNDAACFTLKLYIAEKIVLAERGCVQGCENFQREGSFMWHEINCCYTDYCNQ